MELKDRLAELRRSRGYSLRELRERILERTGEQMAISYLSALERVGRAPSIESLGKIAAGYDMSLRELLEPIEEIDQAAYQDLPPGLAEVKRRWGLTDRDVADLTSIQFRGRRPETQREWESILALLGLHDDSE